VSVERLRGWEGRYGVLERLRWPSGQRLYGPADEQRIITMKAHLQSGISSGEAGVVVLDTGPSRSMSVAMKKSSRVAMGMSPLVAM